MTLCKGTPWWIRPLFVFETSDEPGIARPSRQSTNPWNRESIVVLDCSALLGNSVKHAVTKPADIPEVGAEGAKRRMHRCDLHVWRRIVSWDLRELFQQLIFRLRAEPRPSLNWSSLREHLPVFRIGDRPKGTRVLLWVDKWECKRDPRRQARRDEN